MAFNPFFEITEQIDMGTDNNSKGLLLTLVKNEAFFIAFPTLYLVEKGFSAVFILHNNYIKKLVATSTSTSDDLRLMVKSRFTTNYADQQTPSIP